MPGVLLPSALRSKMDELAARQRSLHIRRGILIVIAWALAGGSALLVADAVLVLPTWVRMPALVLWIATIGFAIWKTLIQPLSRTLGSAELAAAVETTYPRFDERLTTAVELSDSAGVANGSPAFIDLLLRETEQRASGIDFRRAAPVRPPRAAACVALTIAAVLIAAGLIWPDLVQGLGRRFIAPWDDRPAIEPFAILVTPGDAAIAKGRPWTIRAELARLRGNEALPENCTLVVTPQAGKPLRLQMKPGEQPDSHSARLDAPTGDFHYAVFAGPIRTREYIVSVVEPVELIGGRIVVVPPTYARSAAPAQTLDTVGDFSVFQHGSATLTCRLSRPAIQAKLHWAQTGRPNDEPQSIFLSGDGLTAETVLPTRASGSFRIVFEADGGVTTETATHRLTAVIDRPPEFRQVTGLGESLNEIGATDVLPLRLGLSDDIAVASAELEFRVNDGQTRRLPLTLAGLGSAQAAGASSVALKDLVKPGDRFACRLIATDNRSVPEAGLVPQVATYPGGDRWCELQVVSQSSAVREREIAARRDAIDQAIRDLIARLERDAQAAGKLQQEIQDKSTPPAEQTRQLGQLTASCDKVRADVEMLARDAETAGLMSVADGANSIANRELRDVSDHLRDAAVDANPQTDAVRNAEQAMVKARDKLESLLKSNQEAARKQLDAAQVEQLADKQQQLAGDTKAQSDAASQDRIAKDQRGLADDLDRMTKENESARNGLKGAEAEQARKLAEQARTLAKSERDLDQSIRDETRKQNAAKLAEVAKQQKGLAEEAERLAKKNRRASEAAKATPLQTDDAKRAAEALKNGDADDAALQQKRAGENLDRLADQLQKALELSRDPREAAKQLSRMQADTRRRTLESSKPNPDDRNELIEEERALRKAVEQLPIADNQNTARREQSQIMDKAKKAIEELEKDHPNTAAELMKQAQQSLDRLAEALPNAEQRHKAAREAVAELRKKQDEIGKNTQSAENKDLRALAKRQSEMTEQIARLDAPNLESRRDAARDAAANARDDLKNARATDVPASQDSARRALERLDDALQGKKPADAKARELAEKQRELAAEAANAKGDSGKMQALQPRQESIAREALSLEATEAPTRQADAAAAAGQANQAMRDRPADPKTPEALQDAAKKLDELASQLDGQETPAERAARLARQQAKQVESPSQNSVESRRRANQISEETRQIRAGEQAAAEKRAATEALKRAQRTPTDSPESGPANQAAAEALDRLAKKLGESGADKNAQAGSAKQSPAPSGAVTPEQVQQVRDLAKRQQELQQGAQDAANGSQPPADAAARQDSLAKQSSELGQSLQEDVSPPAANHAKQAEAAMREAIDSSKAGQPVAARDARRRAAESLDRAAEEAAKFADEKQNAGGANPGRNPGGTELQRARRQMEQALQQLNRGEGNQAGSAMNDAADALKQAAEGIRGQSGKASASGPDGAAGKNGPSGAGPESGKPQLPADLARELDRHTGKKWGELPGELRTRIMQDLKAQYGDDYARIIRLYFDTLAERK